MNRKEFLQSLGLGTIGLGLSTSNIRSNPQKISSCTIVPSETIGPFPLDLDENEFFFRQDIRETEDGVPLRQRIRVLGAENCLPMPNVRVNIWHCNNKGSYSGYDVTSNPGQDGLTYHRGYQFTDANGEVEFLTQFPGIYPGRICHIHFQVYVDSMNQAVSQYTYPIEEKNNLYLNNPDLYQSGADPLDFNSDGAFRDSVEHQLATLEFDSDKQEYNSFYEVTVDGSGITRVPYQESIIKEFIEVGQNYPNPYTDLTSVPILLKQRSNISLEIFSLNGKKLYNLEIGLREKGDHLINVKPNELGLNNQNYIYQIVIKVNGNIYKIPKMMTHLK